VPRRTGIAALATGICCSLALGAGSASAAENFGSNLDAAATTGPAINTSSVQTTQVTGVTQPLVPANPGVITLILVRHGPSGADPGTYGFRVLTGSTPNFTATGAPSELPDFAWPANDTPGVTSFVPTLGGIAKGIPIPAGGHLGIVRSGGTSGQGAQIGAFGTTPGGVLHAAPAVHNSGPLGYTNNGNSELLLRYSVEPDADGDGYGDQTQDLCPAQAGTQGACVAPAKTTKKKKKKCKKRKKKPAAAAKKKCKKGKK
jgi:hypothetical protein